MPAQEPEYRAIFEASSDGLAINDAETGVVVEANPAFCRMHGYERMVGLHPTTFIHPDSHRQFLDYVRTLRDGFDYRGRAQDVRHDGSVFDVEVLGRGFTYQGHFAMLDVRAIYGPNVDQSARQIRDRRPVSSRAILECRPAVQGHPPVLTVPLLVDGQPRGAITRFYALAIENTRPRRCPGAHPRSGAASARARGALRRRQLLHGSLRLDRVLQALVDVAADILHSDKSTVLVRDAQHVRIVAEAPRRSVGCTRASGSRQMTRAEPTAERVRVLIVDDHEMVRSGLAAFLRVTRDFELVGEAATGEDAIRLCQALRPDVVLMDMPCRVWMVPRRLGRSACAARKRG